MPGRPPKSIQKHKLDGTYRKDRHADRGSNLKPIESALKCPESVKGKKAREAWKRIVPKLCESRLVTEADIDTLEDAFRCLDIADSLYDAVEDAGGTVEYLKEWRKGEKDFLFEARRYMDAYEKIMWKFGVTPVEAGKIRGAKKEDTEDASAVKNIIGNG